MIYIVTKCTDFVEGRGPNIFHSAFQSFSEAEAFVLSQAGIFGSPQYEKPSQYSEYKWTYNGYDIIATELLSDTPEVKVDGETNPSESIQYMATLNNFVKYGDFVKYDSREHNDPPIDPINSSGSRIAKMVVTGASGAEFFADTEFTGTVPTDVLVMTLPEWESYCRVNLCAISNLSFYPVKQSVGYEIII